MVIYAENIPEQWFGHTFEFLGSDGIYHKVKVTGIVNGNTLLAQNGEATPLPYFNVQSFAMLLLSGRAHRVD